MLVCSSSSKHCLLPLHGKRRLGTCKPLSTAICCCCYHTTWRERDVRRLFEAKYIYFPFRSVFFPLWKGANDTSTVNQAFYSPGHHGCKDLCIIKIAADVICSTASLIGIWVSAPPPPSKFWYFGNDSHTSAHQSSKITLRTFWHLYFQDVLAGYYPNKVTIHTSLTRTLERYQIFSYTHVCMVALEGSP